MSDEAGKVRTPFHGGAASTAIASAYIDLQLRFGALVAELTEIPVDAALLVVSNFHGSVAGRRPVAVSAAMSCRARLPVAVTHRYDTAMVVASRGASAGTTFALGSVATAVAEEADLPVILARGGYPPWRRGQCLWRTTSTPLSRGIATARSSTSIWTRSAGRGARNR